MNVGIEQKNDIWYVKLFEGDKFLCEMGCFLQEDLGWVIQEIMDWRGLTDSRTRILLGHKSNPVGGIFYVSKI